MQFARGVRRGRRGRGLIFVLRQPSPAAGVLRQAFLLRRLEGGLMRWRCTASRAAAGPRPSAVPQPRSAKRLRNPLQHVPNEPARTILAPQCRRTFHVLVRTSLEVAHCVDFVPFRFHEKRCGVPIRKRWCHRVGPAARTSTLLSASKRAGKGSLFHPSTEENVSSARVENREVAASPAHYLGRLSGPEVERVRASVDELAVGRCECREEQRPTVRRAVGRAAVHAAPVVHRHCEQQTLSVLSAR